MSDSNGSIIGGHAQYAKGAAEEAIGSATGSQEWKDSGASDKQVGTDSIKSAAQAHHQAQGQGQGGLSESAEQLAEKGCPAPSSRPSRPITVLYFASARTAVGTSSEQIPLARSPLPLSELAQILLARHKENGLERVLASAQWSVQQEMVDEDRLGETLLMGGEEVAVIPPVSGG